MEGWPSHLFCGVIGERVEERRGKKPGARSPERAECARACAELYSSRRDINNGPPENKGNKSVWAIELDDWEAWLGPADSGNNERHRAAGTWTIGGASETHQAKTPTE